VNKEDHTLAIAWFVTAAVVLVYSIGRAAWELWVLHRSEKERKQYEKEMEERDQWSMWDD
jgi:predicted RNase H-related nuclease YkuK (DUF458 family)